MSHVAATDDFVITDIALLQQTIEETCPELEMVPGSNYRTWIADNGRLVGDYTPPAWMKKDEIGKNAEYVIRYKQQYKMKHPKAYEIGVVPCDGNYRLAVDFWAQGNGLLKSPGLGQATGSGKSLKMLGDLRRNYSERLIEDYARRRGKKVNKSESNGRTVYRIEA